MVTGFASAHGFGSESFMALLHVLFGEAILICLPFTRLSHAILIPFTRAYMGEGNQNGDVYKRQLFFQK